MCRVLGPETYRFGVALAPLARLRDPSAPSDAAVDTFSLCSATLVAVEAEATRALVRVAGGLWLPARVRRPLPRGAPPEGCGAHVTFADNTAEAHVVRHAAHRAPRAARRAGPCPQPRR